MIHPMRFAFRGVDDDVSIPNVWLSCLTAGCFASVAGARTVSLGCEVDRYKLLAFMLSATLAGLAGATKTGVQGFETLTGVH